MILGIDNTAARMLLLLRNIPDINFQNVLTLGHQRSYISVGLQKRISKELGVPKDSISQDYSDGFMKAIGVETLQFLDISGYENATIIHDLNTPIPDSLREKFTLVLDIGTSEHVFNVTQSLENLRNLCKSQGHVLIVSPANNWLGHGFYQFSPELFFRAFDTEYGFEVKSLYLIKKGMFRESWYKLNDPKNMGRRGTILTNKRCYIAVIASKSVSTIAVSSPQQSDYVSAWEGQGISKLGSVYLRMPRPVRSILDRTIIAIRMRIKNRLTPIRFRWSDGKYLPTDE